MILVLAIAVSVLATVLVGLFFTGYLLDEADQQSELDRVRIEALRAERELHEITRRAFVAMTEVAEERRSYARPHPSMPPPVPMVWRANGDSDAGRSS